MTLTDAAGCITRQESLLRDTLAACAHFQTLVNAENANDAKESIYLEAVPLPEQYSDKFTVDQIRARRPFAYIWTGESQAFTFRKIAAPGSVTPNGILYIRIERDVPEEIETNYAEVDRTFKNIVGLIISSGSASSPGLVELNGLAGYRDWELLTFSGPARTNDDEVPTLGDSQMCEIEIRYGVTA